ncbi:MAG: CBS domain-containing protein [Spirochaetes bacterium]|nr:CBS domain-containing protein [Spirochaetota bacterium]MBU1079697.1 CBS domain-containing protein [Spirochaetota bacterium]
MDSFPIDTDGGPQVVLELIYRLKVKDVMTSAVVTASPTASLREVQAMMRERGITGVPIVEADRLVGIVSIGDIIEALDGGWIGESAGSRMSDSLIVLEDDMPLSFAITYFNRYGYRRFPVLDKDASLAGIITAADVLRALLIEMNREVERLEEGLAKRRAASAAGAASPGSGAAAPLVMSFACRRFDFENAGKASGELKKALKALGADPASIRRAAIVSYELEMNQVIHSDGGTMEFSAADGAVSIVAKDDGPGIADLEAALTEGFSTANEWVRSLGFGAGLGLPNAKRSSDEFDISSKIGVGTTVRALVRYQEKT